MLEKIFSKGNLLSKKILVVDDEPDLVRLVKLRLEAAGYRVLTAFDGMQGLECAHREKPDLILMDVVLPAMNGYQVCHTLKNEKDFKSIPIILFTARIEQEDTLLGKQAGADDCLHKPFDGEVLLEKISHHLR